MFICGCSVVFSVYGAVWLFCIVVRALTRCVAVTVIYAVWIWAAE